MSNLAEAATERRRHRRYPILESGILYGTDGPIDCQVTDLSASGARVRPVDAPPAYDGRCRFLLARLGLFDAAIRWRANGVLGLDFDAAPDVVAARCAPLLAAENQATSVRTALLARIEG